MQRFLSWVFSHEYTCTTSNVRAQEIFFPWGRFVIIIQSIGLIALLYFLLLNSRYTIQSFVMSSDIMSLPY